MNACIKGRGGSGGTESCIDQQAINEATKRKRTLMDYVIEKTIDIEGRNNKKFIATCR